MKFMKGCALVLILIILVFIVGGLAMSMLFSYTVVESVDEVINATPAPAQEYSVLNPAVVDKATISVKEWGWQTANEWFEPEPGCAVYGVRVEYVNTSDDIAYVSSYDFNAYADNVACVPYIWNSDNSYPATDLASGRVASGWLYFNVPMTAQSFELECKVGYNNTVVFKF